MTPLLVDELVTRALKEDLGDHGDITTEAILTSDVSSRAVIRCRTDGTVAGMPVAKGVFEVVDPSIRWQEKVADGSYVEAGEALVELGGSARSLLTAERTALNFLGHLSGIATATAELVKRVEGTGCRIVDTRKTTPGLRALEKYAVRQGGGVNHRFGLHDAVLIKDNHIVAAGGIRAAVERARRAIGHMVKIEVEVDCLDQVEELLEVGADVVLLDNMEPSVLRQAVERVGDSMVTEASGTITVDTVREVAETGVNYISSGWITHSAPSLDIGLDFVD